MITIFSVCHNTQKAGGGVQLHASDLGFYEIGGIGEPGREHSEFTTCSVPDTVYDIVYMGADAPDGRQFQPVPIDGRKHANAIIESFRRWGIAVAEGEVPRPDEIAAAKAVYHAFLDEQLQIGQSVWSETRNPGRIPHFAKVAAQVFGVSVEWMTPISGAARKRCPNCDTAAPEKAAWCVTCHFVFDMEKAVAGGFLPAIQANAAVIAAAAAAETAETPPEPAVVRGRGKSGF